MSRSSETTQSGFTWQTNYRVGEENYFLMLLSKEHSNFHNKTWDLKIPVAHQQGAAWVLTPTGPCFPEETEGQHRAETMIDDHS